MIGPFAHVRTLLPVTNGKLVDIKSIAGRPTI